VVSTTPRPLYPGERPDNIAGGGREFLRTWIMTSVICGPTSDITASQTVLTTSLKNRLHLVTLIQLQYSYVAINLHLPQARIRETDSHESESV
jgi:hypothetical protein